jgi:hypothetical protein
VSDPLPTTPWTRHRVREALAVLYGSNSRGNPDVPAAAADLAVSQSTVYRWLAGPGHQRADISTAHLAALRPPPAVVAEQLRQLNLARTAMARIARGDVLDSWTKQHWLDPHVVATLELTAPTEQHPARRRAPHLRQVTTARLGTRGERDISRRGRVLARIQVEGRFPATVLATSLLIEINKWRVRGPDWVDVGPNQVWLPDAARIDLPTMAVTAGAMSPLSLPGVREGRTPVTGPA